MSQFDLNSDINTFAAHTPDNSFLGFAVSDAKVFVRKEANFSLLYGKSANFAKVSFICFAKVSFI
jgi:hypothetical protein